MEGDTMTTDETRTKLNSHAIMVVIGRNTYIHSPLIMKHFQRFQSSMQPSYMSALRNALSVPVMECNLILPFVMQEAGIRVNDTPRIQVHEPIEEDHSIFFPSDNVRIPLLLWGVFSYFPLRVPTREELIECNVLILTPEGSWNSHSDVYARNEENMMDWEGQMVEPKDRV